MEIPQDPMILCSYINMLLRDDYPSLDALCEDKEIDRQTLEDKLKAVGFEYDPEHNRFW
ncbi:MAG: DUF4250 domain-containing protein [Bacteroidaceae bacterium]|nr:DUF4250 domain-containing protein [Bacteroidaceae bacterium]MBR1542093.1 DUF4250 domain-containing protein [Bacteroidaceae bacterium]